MIPLRTPAPLLEPHALVEELRHLLAPPPRDLERHRDEPDLPPPPRFLPRLRLLVRLLLPRLRHLRELPRRVVLYPTARERPPREGVVKHVPHTRERVQANDVGVLQLYIPNLRFNIIIIIGNFDFFS